jgi:hypothetical protein
MIDEFIENLTNIVRKLKSLTPEERAELKTYNVAMFLIVQSLIQFNRVIENVNLKVGIERIRNGD